VTEILEQGACVCGEPIPDTSPSDWACGELCQAAWMQHHANPEYPHPRDIRQSMRENLRRPAAQLMVPAATIDREPVAIAEGVEISVDGQGFVRIAGRWQQTGQWHPLQGRVADAMAYLRWCPQCRQPRRYRIHVPLENPTTRNQTCRECHFAWPGKPVIGIVEWRGEPWPALRMRLSDGERSAGRTFEARGARPITSADQIPDSVAVARQFFAIPSTASWDQVERAMLRDRRRVRWQDYQVPERPEPGYAP
jgi:hypothetical protein